MLLDCKDLSYRYPGSKIEIFTNINYCLSGPGFHALFGPSGVGKTTLAKMMTGDIVGFTGEITKSCIDRILYTYNLERIPGFEKLSGLLIMIFVVLAIMWVIDSTRIFVGVFSFMPFWVVLAIFAGALALARFGMNKFAK